MPPKQPSIVCALPPLFLIEFFPADTPHPNPRLPADAGPFRAQSEHLTSLVGKLSESVTPKAAARYAISEMSLAKLENGGVDYV